MAPEFSKRAVETDRLTLVRQLTGDVYRLDVTRNHSDTGMSAHVLFTASAY